MRFEDLDQIVDAKFWRIINDLRVHDSRKQRVPFLQKLASELAERKYFPGLPLTIKEADKGNGVARQIPIFNLKDYSVFYYCIRKLEHVLAKNRVSGTYGGWSMGGKIRNLEKGDEPAGDYQLTYSYNPAAWAKYYGDFNGRLFGKIQELQEAGKENYIIFELDIANYYDSVQLDLLEKKIRRDGDYNESGILDLLMYFIGYSNRLVTQYQKRTVGIPQDAFGDCSRLLANYYLQEYDLYMNELAKKYNAFYFRYADDQILFVPDEQSGKDMIQMASRRLSGLGLNINQKKVIKRTLSELYIHRSFAINDLFKTKGANTNQALVNEFAEQAFAAIDEDSKNLKNRGYPLIKRLTTADYNLLKPSYRSRILRYIFDESFTKDCRSNNFNSAYTKMREEEKADYIKYLDGLCVTSRHSAFHYEVLAFFRRNDICTDAVENRIEELRKEVFNID